MKLKDKLIKIVSYGFVSFLVIIIIIAFGMPDFLGQGDQTTRYLAADVAGERISRRELATARDNMARDPRFSSANLPANFLESQALEQLIDRRLFYLMSHAVEMYPGEKVQSKIIAKYLRQNHGDFMKGSTFEFDKFKEVLNRNQVKFSQLKSDAVKNFTIQKNFDLMTAASITNDLDALEKKRLEETKLTYEIVAMNTQEKEKIVQSLIKITNKDIKEQFKKDYLSKDKKSKLTKTKRDAIKSKLKNLKKGEAEKKFKSTLAELVKKSSLRKIARKYKLKVFKLKNVPLSKTLDSVKSPKLKISLVSLENSRRFRKSIFTQDLGQVIGPVEEGGNLYLFTVLKRKIANLPSSTTVIKEKKKLTDITGKKEFELKPILTAIQKKHEPIIMNSVFALLKEQYTIKRYKKPGQ